MLYGFTTFIIKILANNFSKSSVSVKIFRKKDNFSIFNKYDNLNLEKTKHYCYFFKTWIVFSTRLRIYLHLSA